MVPAPSRRSGFNGSLDGLRGIAALNVVFAHYVLAFFPFLLKGQYSDFFQPVCRGLIGISLAYWIF